MVILTVLRLTPPHLHKSISAASSAVSKSNGTSTKIQCYWFNSACWDSRFSFISCIFFLSWFFILITDSGASCHGCHDLHLFASSHSVDSTHITLPDKTKLAVSMVGTVVLSDSLQLHNVFYVPQVNLISVGLIWKWLFIPILLWYRTSTTYVIAYLLYILPQILSSMKGQSIVSAVS